MIENMNNLISLVVLIFIIIASIYGYFKLNSSFKKDDNNDEYYRDLL